MILSCRSCLIVSRIDKINLLIEITVRSISLDESMCVLLLYYFDKLMDDCFRFYTLFLEMKANHTV